MRLICSSLTLTLALSGACGGGNSTPIDASDPIIDAPLVDAVPSDAPWITPPALANLSFDGPVLTSVHVGDAWYVGGYFTFAEMVPARKLAAVDLAGQPTACNVENGFDGYVNRLTHVGNAIYAVGPFSRYRGQSANRIAKIDMTTCQLDTTFSPPGNNGFDADVRTIATNGTAIFVGGLFTTYRGASANHIAKLDPTTGDLDPTFSPPANNGVDAPVLAIVASSTDVYLGGDFTAYRGVASSANFVARLNAADGALVATFGPAGATTNGFDSQVITLAQSGTTLWVGGDFAKYKNVAGSATRLAKIDLTTGAIDTTFSPVTNGFDNQVRAFALAGNTLYVGGAFSAYRGVAGSARRIAKLDATTGALDLAFSPLANNGFTGNIHTLAVAGGSVFVSGSPLGGYRGSPDLNGITKLDATSGVMDATFLRPVGHDRIGLSAFSRANTIDVVGTTLWLGGDFTHLGGKSANHIARFPDATGVLDTTFSPPGANGFEREVYALATFDNALYVGGEFTSYRGQPQVANRLAKLDLLTGVQDAAFSPPGATSNGFNGAVNAFAVTATALYVGGSFSQYRGVINSASGIAKLDPQTGTQDAAFSPVGVNANGFDDGVTALAASADAIYAGGDFVSYRGGTDNARGLGKLHPSTGALDTTFSPPGTNGVDDEIHALLIHGDALYLGGRFSTYRGTPQVNRIAKVDRLTGVLDTAFTAPGASAGFDEEVDALAVSGNALFAGGAFLAYRGVPASASFLAKLDLTSGNLVSGFTPSGATVTGASVVSIVPFQSSLMLGGTFLNCEFSRCYSNGHRVNRDTRMPE